MSHSYFVENSQYAGRIRGKVTSDYSSNTQELFVFGEEVTSLGWEHLPGTAQICPVPSCLQPPNAEMLTESLVNE